MGPTQGAKEGTTGYLLGDLEGVANVRVKHLVMPRFGGPGCKKKKVVFIVNASAK